MKRHLLAMLPLLACCLLSSPALAARFVPIEVYLDGELILQGNASDDGSPDADQVWDALKQVNLGETDAFKEMFGENVDDAFNILRKRSDREQPLIISIHVAYGGMAKTKTLRILRKPADGAGRVWRIHHEEVSRLFNARMIRRSDVVRLSNPKRSE